MQNDISRGTAEMTAAMVISGTIGWFVVMSGQPVSSVVFWRCLFGAASLLVICGALGFLKPGILSPKAFGIASPRRDRHRAELATAFCLLFPRLHLDRDDRLQHAAFHAAGAWRCISWRENNGEAKLFWLALAFAGMLAIVEAKPEAGGVSGSYGLGIALALGAAFFYALAAIAAKWLKGTPPHLIALVQVSTGILMLAPVTDFSNLPATAGSWSILAAMGVVHTGLMYVLLYGAIQKLPTHTFIYPIVAIAVDALAFGHALQPFRSWAPQSFFLRRRA